MTQEQRDRTSSRISLHRNDWAEVKTASAMSADALQSGASAELRAKDWFSPENCLVLLDELRSHGFHLRPEGDLSENIVTAWCNRFSAWCLDHLARQETPWKL